MTADAPPTRCPKCRALLFNNHGDIECLSCGTLQTVPRAGDPAGFDRADAAEYDRGNRLKIRSPLYSHMPWTEEEKRTFEEWEPGDPLPDDSQEEKPAVIETPEPVPPTTACPVCGHIALSIGGMKVHMARKHKNAPKNIEPPPPGMKDFSVVDHLLADEPDEEEEPPMLEQREEIPPVVVECYVSRVDEYLKVLLKHLANNYTPELAGRIERILGLRPPAQS